MKIKKALAVIMAFCMAVILCGCDLFEDANELLSPPELTGEMAPIAKALEKSAGSDCDLKYPAEGEYRSAIVLEDINGDAIYEAFAFYSTSDDEMTNMHINAICQIDGKWTSVADQTIVATGVEKVEFCDLDGDDNKEIVVGWDVNGTSEKQLSLFTFENNILTQQLLQSYTGFLCCDLDENQKNELFVHLLNTSEKTNKAMVFGYNKTDIEQTAYCVMDASVKSASKPILATLSNGQKAIYIDEIKGVGSVTEVLYFSQGELVNPLLDDENSFENISTVRAASLETQDINGDGTIEIPIASDLPNAISDGEKLYYTNWCSFNGELLSVKLITIVNTVDGYYLTVPSTMVGYVAVLKDTENHIRKFYHYDPENSSLGKELFTITAIKTSKWDKEDFDRGDMVELDRKGGMVFAVSLGESAQAFAITTDTVKDTFYLVD